MISRRIFLFIAFAIILSTAPRAFSQRQQPPVSQAAIEQIRKRPARIIAKPFDIAIADIAIELINQPNVDLRPTIKTMGISIRNQGGRGTCSVFAMTFLLEYMYAKQKGYMNPDFSEEYLNYASNLAINQFQDGGFFDALDLGYQTYGILNESQAAYHDSYNPPYVASAAMLATGEAIAPRFKAAFIKPWDVTTGLTQGELQGIEHTLDTSRPVAVGVRWPSNFQTDTIHGIQLMKTPLASGVFDGHSIDLVGYKASNSFPGGGYFIFRNSYGTGFGVDGYGFMSFDYAKKYVNDAVDYYLSINIPIPKTPAVVKPMLAR